MTAPQPAVVALVLACALAAMGAAAAATLGRHDVALYTPLVDDPECNGTATSCSGCSSLVQCMQVNGKWKKLKTVACGGDAPYCADGACQRAIPPAGSKCGAPKLVDFVCPEANGYFPDMASCTRYYFCVNNEAFAMDCVQFPGTVYDQRSTLCVAASPGECYTLPCTQDKLLVPQPYAPAPWIYAVCLSSNPAEALVGTCPSAFAMDPELGCVLACNAAGRFADPRTGDPRAYFECAHATDGQLGAPMLGLCPSTSLFNAVQQQCVTSW